MGGESFISFHMAELIPNERIENKIYLIRGKKVMLDADLAVLYDVPTKALNQTVRRNIERFPEDFMFRLSDTEAKSMWSQIVTTSKFRRTSAQPFVFTEQGVAMLSSVLKSKQAIAVNIQIIRTFTKLREMIQENQSLRLKIEALEKTYDEQFRIVFDAIRRLLTTDEGPKEEIGFRG